MESDETDTLREAAEFFYDVCELYEDEDLDPDDHIEVLRRAFTTSNCDDFAAALSDVAGWPVVTASWTTPKGGYGHHALVRSPDGRLLDVTGWIDETALKSRYGIPDSYPLHVADGHLSAPLADEFERELIERVIHALPDLVSILADAPSADRRYADGAGFSP